MRRAEILLTLLCLSGAALAGTRGAPLGTPEVLVTQRPPAPQLAQQLRTARQFYAFWNTGSARTLSAVISPHFVDRDLPPGRPQGPGGPLFAIRQFRQAVPDLRCAVTQQIVAGDRVVSNLRFTGHFTGTFGKLHGKGQTINFVATDILRIQAGRITDNWHIEDNLTFQKQVGAVK